MTAFYFAFLAVILAGLGARDQTTMATLSQRQGARPGALLTGIVVSIATAAFAAWAGSFVVPLLDAQARLVMVVIALLLAALESVWPFTGRRLDEPTASLGALGIVLLAHQMTDAARFIVFALTVATNAPFAAGIGGAAGGTASLAAAWMLPEVFAVPKIRLWRRICGAMLLVVALPVAFRALTG